MEPSGWTQCAFDKQHSELRKHYSLSSGPHRGGRAASATEERQNVAGLQSGRPPRPRDCPRGVHNAYFKCHPLSSHSLQLQPAEPKLIKR